MLNELNATIEVISYNAGGFVFSVTVDESIDDSQLPFHGLNETGTDFTVPLRSIVIKIAILSSAIDATLDNFQDPNPNVSYLPSGKQKESDSPIYIKKHLETQEAFADEAAFQQHVYLSTIAPSGKPSCLSVIDYSWFDNANAIAFLDKLRSTILVDSQPIHTGWIPSIMNIFLPNPTRQESQDPVTYSTQKTLDYLKSQISGGNNDRRIGIIAMELANRKEYISLFAAHNLSFLQLPNNMTLTEPSVEMTPELLANYMDIAVAHLFKVLITTNGIVNVDLHSNNVLINIRTSEVKIIDYGKILVALKDRIPQEIKEKYQKRTSLWTNQIWVGDDAYETVGSVDELLDLIGDIKGCNLSNKSGREDIPDTKKIILLLHLLAELDIAYNERYQMITLLDHMYGNVVESSDREFVKWNNPNTAHLNIRVQSVYEKYISLTNLADPTAARNAMSVPAIARSVKERTLSRVVVSNLPNLYKRNVNMVKPVVGERDFKKSKKARVK